MDGKLVNLHAQVSKSALAFADLLEVACRFVQAPVQSRDADRLPPPPHRRISHAGRSMSRIPPIKLE